MPCNSQIIKRTKTGDKTLARQFFKPIGQMHNTEATTDRRQQITLPSLLINTGRGKVNLHFMNQDDTGHTRYNIKPSIKDPIGVLIGFKILEAKQTLDL